MRVITRSLTLLAVPLLLLACDDDDVADVDTTFDLVVTGDETFQGAHGGQDISVALVDDDGDVVTMSSGTVSATADPTFSFAFDNVLESGESYEVHTWIDSNFGDDGTAGVCDPPEVDHQWNIAIPTVSADVTIDDTHRPGEISSVCDTF